VLGLLTVVYALNFLDHTIFNVLIEPIKKEFTLSDTTMGLLAGFGFVLFYSLLGIPIARVADRLNRRNIVALAFAFWSQAPRRLPRVGLPSRCPMKPFWGTHETIMKQTRNRSVANKTAVKTPGGSYEPFIALSGPFDPPENRDCRARGRHRGSRFRHLRPHQFGLRPDRSRR
jgi:hypothetical protein